MTEELQTHMLRSPVWKAKRRSLIATSMGNLLEWYEWSIYAVFAPFVADVMFAASDSTSALLGTFAVLAVSFLFRPLGGVVFGWIADRLGRKFVLICTMLMMAAGSAAIAVMPTFEMVGTWAAVILLAVRAVQGLAHGGESTASTTYITEIAPNGRRGLWSSFVNMAIVGGTVLAYALGAALTAALGDEAILAWAWRIPFAAGALAALFILWLRRNMVESDAFEANAGTEDARAAWPRAAWPRRRVAKATVMMILFISGSTVVQYTWSSYISTFAISSRGMDASTAYWMSLVAQCVVLACLPLFGRLSDQFGRRPQVLFFAAFSAVMTIPLTNMIGSEWWSLLIPQTVALVVWALSSSVFSAILAEHFPTSIRSRGVGFSYSLGVALFGGTAPYLNQLFVGMDLGWIYHVYLIVLCGCTFLATLRMRETKGIDLRTLEFDAKL